MIDPTTEVATWTAPADGRYLLLAAVAGGLRATGANTGYTVVVGDERPDVVIGEQYGPSGKVYPGDILYLEVDAHVRGVMPAGEVEVGVYLSSDAEVTTSDTLFAAVALLREGPPHDAGEIRYGLGRARAGDGALARQAAEEGKRCSRRA